MIFGFALLWTILISQNGTETETNKKNPIYNIHKKKLEQKKETAKIMKKISASLGYTCKDCHLEPEKGLEKADWSLLTKLGKFSLEVMFPLSYAFSVECSFCHDGRSYTRYGIKAQKDHEKMALIAQSIRPPNKNLACNSCHIVQDQKDYTSIKEIIPTKNIQNPFLLHDKWKIYKGLWQKYEPLE